MNYIKSMNIYGTDFKEIPCITGEGVPTTTTAGGIGSFYMNTNTGDVYKCTNVSDDNYTWEIFNSGTDVSNSNKLEIKGSIDYSFPSEANKGDCYRITSLSPMSISDEIEITSATFAPGNMLQLTMNGIQSNNIIYTSDEASFYCIIQGNETNDLGIPYHYIVSGKIIPSMLVGGFDITIDENTNSTISIRKYSPRSEGDLGEISWSDFVDLMINLPAYNGIYAILTIGSPEIAENINNAVTISNTYNTGDIVYYDSDYSSLNCAWRYLYKNNTDIIEANNKRSVTSNAIYDKFSKLKQSINVTENGGFEAVNGAIGNVPAGEEQEDVQANTVNSFALGDGCIAGQRGFTINFEDTLSRSKTETNNTVLNDDLYNYCDTLLFGQVPTKDSINYSYIELTNTDETRNSLLQLIQIYEGIVDTSIEDNSVYVLPKSIYASYSMSGLNYTLNDMIEINKINTRDCRLIVNSCSLNPESSKIGEELLCSKNLAKYIGDETSRYAFSIWFANNPNIGIKDITMRAVAFNRDTKALGDNSISTGRKTIAKGDYAHADGYESQANGNTSHAINKAIANGALSFAQGSAKSNANGQNSASFNQGVANGPDTLAGGRGAIANGTGSIAFGSSAPDGTTTEAGSGTGESGEHSIAVGAGVKAYGLNSAAFNFKTQANKAYTSAFGNNTIAGQNNQSVRGSYNIIHDEPTSITDENGNTTYPTQYLDVVGNGKSNDERSDAYTLDTKGNGVFAGDVYNKNGKLYGKSELIDKKYLHSLGYTDSDANYLGEYESIDCVKHIDFTTNTISFEEVEWLEKGARFILGSCSDFDSLSYNYGIFGKYYASLQTGQEKIQLIDGVAYIDDIDYPLYIEPIGLSLNNGNPGSGYDDAYVVIYDFKLYAHITRSDIYQEVEIGDTNLKSGTSYEIDIDYSNILKVNIDIDEEAIPKQLKNNFNEGDIYKVKTNNIYPASKIINANVKLNNIRFKMYSENSFELAASNIDALMLNPSKKFNIDLTINMSTNESAFNVFKIIVNDANIMKNSKDSINISLNDNNVYYNDYSNMSYSENFKQSTVDKLYETYLTANSDVYNTSYNLCIVNDPEPLVTSYDRPPYNYFNYTYKYGNNFIGEVTIVEEMPVVGGDTILFNGTNWVKIYDNSPKAGISDNRPVNPYSGQQFFDTTLNKPIWYNGTNWVDCNGAEC